jgi:RHS repeat-associated protein
MVWKERSEWVALEGDKLLLAVDREESGEQRERYLWGVEGLLAEESGRFNQSSQPAQVTIWLAADQQGTVRDWYNDAGNYLDHYTYDSFGKVVWRQMSGNTMHPRFGYADSETDENGLSHMGRRMYDPQSGRFLQPDPLGFADDANPFSYAHNNPLTWRDPSGLSAVNVVRGVGAGLSAVAPMVGGVVSGLGAAMTAGRTLYGAGGVGGWGGSGSSSLSGAGSILSTSGVMGHDSLVRDVVAADLNRLAPLGSGGAVRRAEMGADYDPGTGGWTEGKRQFGLTFTKRPVNFVRGIKSSIEAAASFVAIDMPHTYFGAWSEQTYVENSHLVQYLSGHALNNTTPIVGDVKAFGSALVSKNPDVQGDAWFNLGVGLISTKFNPGRPVNVVRGGVGVGAPVGTVTRGGIGPVLKGQAGVNRAITEYEAAGGQVLGKNINLRVGGGRTVPDLYGHNAAGIFEFLEVKNGASAILNQNQARLFPLIRQGGAVPVGANAARAGLVPGVPLPATPVRVITYP